MPMHRFLEWHAKRFMTPSPETLSPKTTLRDLETLFSIRDFNAFPVVDDGGTMIGLVTKFDFLKAFAFTTRQLVPNYEQLMRTKIEDVMTTAVVHVRVDAPLTHVLQLMIELRARSFPVVEDNGRLAGMISRTDLMRALNEATEQGS
jgi:CBS domain-containing protein